jgi:hypothetical protein
MFWAVEVDRRQQHRLLAQAIAERHLSPRLVLQRQTFGNRRADPVLDRGHGERITQGQPPHWNGVHDLPDFPKSVLRALREGNVGSESAR